MVAQLFLVIDKTPILTHWRLFLLKKAINYSNITHIAVIAQVVEHFHGKEKVDSASLSNGSICHPSSVGRAIPS